VVFAQSGIADVIDAATVYEDEPGDNGGIYGEICIGNLSGTGDTRRAFVRFELPPIPDGSIVTRVQYELIQIRPRGGCASCPKTAELLMRRALSDWEEGLGGQSNAACGGGSASSGVTWNTRPTVETTNSAIQFLPAASGVTITIDTDIGDDDDGLIEDVQAWVDNPETNYGWEYRVSDEGTVDNARLINPTSMTIYWAPAPPFEFSDGFESP